MAYARYTDEQIRLADSTDLAKWLKNHGEEVKKVGKDYVWEKNQVWISGSRWYSQYEKAGGYAVAFLQKYFGMSFVGAMKQLVGNPDPNQIALPEQMYEPKPKAQQPLEIPPRSENMKRLYAYLIQNRCIDKDVINHFVRAELLYEDDHHNCVFVGRDENGQIRHLNKRGTNTLTDRPFKHNVLNSDDRYCFHHNGTDDVLYVFEAPIDMISFITLHKENWQQHSYVALCGVSELALEQQLTQNPQLQRIGLCLDRDEAGAAADSRLSQLLKDKGYSTIRILVPKHKDWNEDLQALHGKLPDKPQLAQTQKAAPPDFSLS